MNNKFIRFLIIINGILIPIFIGIILLEFLDNKYNSNYNATETSEVEFKEKYEIRQTSLIKLPNSENFIVAEFKKLTYENLPEIEDEVLLPYTVPSNTVNIIFLDKDFNQIRRLLNKNASIASMFVSNSHSSSNKLVNKMSYLSFYIAVEDSNNDGEINNRDQHYVYISDLNGENLTKVSDRKVKRYEWINDNQNILLTFSNESNSSELKYGVYNIKNKTLTEKKSLKPTE